MLRLGVCGSDRSFLEKVKKMLLTYPGTEGVELFDNREEMLRNILQTDAGIHVVLLDMHGEEPERAQKLHYAEQIYNLAPDVEVLLLLPSRLSADALQHILLRRIRLLGVVTDPEDRELLFGYLNKVLHRQAEEGCLNFSFRGKQHSLELHRVLYLESHNHAIIAHTAHKAFSFYGKLSGLSLPDYFVQCHKSYIVNTRQILTQESKCLVISNGDLIPVSRAYRENLEEKLHFSEEPDD